MPTGLRVTDPAVHIMRNTGREGWSADPAAIASGGHSGFQALNIAGLTGAATAVLLGYDARDPNLDEKWHWFGEHPRRSPPTVFRSYRRSFKDAAVIIAAAGLRVINASPGSAIDAFPRVTLDEALA